DGARGSNVVHQVCSGTDARLTALLPSLSILCYQFLVSIYGGYFGAGVGILMLAVLGFVGLTNIHRMNGLKNWGGLCMNALAALLFAFSQLVNWPVALSMAAGALVGGYTGSRVARRVSERAVRLAIIIIGLGSGVVMLVGQLAGWSCPSDIAGRPDLRHRRQSGRTRPAPR